MVSCRQSGVLRLDPSNLGTAVSKNNYYERQEQSIFNDLSFQELGDK